MRAGTVKVAPAPMNDPSETLDLAVGICTRDSLRTIERTLRSVRGLARRILVVDSGSRDGTVELCRSLDAEVIARPWPGYARQKQFLLEELRHHAWILLLDSDEALEPTLQDSIRQVLRNDDRTYAGWELNRKVCFMGRVLNHTFQPEWRLRLVRGGVARMRGIGADEPTSPAQLHESLDVDGKVGRVRGNLIHDSWADLTDMCRRYIEYGRLAAECGARGGSATRLVFSPAAAFLKQFILKRGFLDGKPGLIAAAGAAMGTLVKHLYLAQRRAGLSGEGG